MQTRGLRAQSRTVRRPRGTPVSQRSLSGLTMSEPVCDGESSVSLQLRQNHEHLSEREMKTRSNTPYSSTAVHVCHTHPTNLTSLQIEHDVSSEVVNLCRGGMLSMALRLLRVDTTLKLSLQSHDTWR